MTSEELTRKKLTIDDMIRGPRTCRTLWPQMQAWPTREAFSWGVSIKYQGDKVAGSIIEGSHRTSGGCNEYDLERGPVLYRRGGPAPRESVRDWTMTRRMSYLGGVDPIGKEVTVETSLYSVIGVLDKRRQPIGTGKNPNDNAILFPVQHFP